FGRFAEHAVGLARSQEMDEQRRARLRVARRYPHRLLQLVDRRVRLPLEEVEIRHGQPRGDGTGVEDNGVVERGARTRKVVESGASHAEEAIETRIVRRFL